MINNPLVIVGSVIHFAQKPLSYSAVRSVYSPIERELQTIATIESVRKQFPIAKIALIEAGTSENFLHQLPARADQYIYVGNISSVKRFVNSKRKGQGEAAALAKGAEQLNIAGIDYFFKLSGRYFLTDEFDARLFSMGGFTAKTYGKQISTRLYGFSADQFEFWKRSMKLSVLQMYFGESIEQALYKKIKDRIVAQPSKLGVGGFVAPDGNRINE